MRRAFFTAKVDNGLIAGISNLFNAIRMSLILMFLMALVNCSGITTPSSFTPRSINDVKFLDRAQWKSDGEIRVSASVPTAEETEALFQADLIKKGIQPIWVKVENHSDQTYYLLPSAADPNHFSPLEVAYAVRGWLSYDYRNEMEHYFRSRSFQNPILPSTAVSGFIFTNLDEGEKVVQIALIGAERVKFFTFFFQIPGMRVDYGMVEFESLYPEEKFVNLTENELRIRLENLPCCTTDQDEMGHGDPMNLVIIGNFGDIAAAFVRQGWLPAEERYSAAVWKTIKSFLFGTRYRYSPLSPLYFYGRHQDFARQKPRHTIHERNHLRLWYSPMRFQNKPVFVGQVSRDIGVYLTTKVWPPVTHKIDPDVDEARNAVIEDLIFSQMVAKVGFVKGVGFARPSKPRTTLTDDPYFTDGYRAVLFIEQGPIALNQVKALNWEKPKTFHLGNEPPMSIQRDTKTNIEWDDFNDNELSGGN